MYLSLAGVGCGGGQAPADALALLCGPQHLQYSSHFKNNCLAEMWSGFEEGSD